jgi:hypothetical protein
MIKVRRIGMAGHQDAIRQVDGKQMIDTNVYFQNTLWLNVSIIQTVLKRWQKVIN